MLCCSISCLSGSISPILFLSNFISKTERERAALDNPREKKIEVILAEGQKRGRSKGLADESFRFGGSCHSFYLFFLLQSHTFIITFIQYTHPSLFTILSPFSSLLSVSGRNHPGVPSPELGPAVQQASVLPTELCCTLTELCCTLTELCCTLTDLCCTLTELCCTLTELCCTLTELCCTLTELCFTLIELCCTLTELCCTLAELWCTLPTRVIKTGNPIISAVNATSQLFSF
jgi:hypothetical protein